MSYSPGSVAASIRYIINQHNIPYDVANFIKVEPDIIIIAIDLKDPFVTCVFLPFIVNQTSIEINNSYR
jgi:hypothetical protein